MAGALEELVPAVNLSLLKKPVDFNNLSPNDFQKIKKLNDGSQGTVYLVQLRGTNKVFAMKVVKKADAIARNKIQRVFTEKEVPYSTLLLTIRFYLLLITQI
jgi:serine/threonine protein kinase